MSTARALPPACQSTTGPSACSARSGSPPASTRPLVAPAKSRAAPESTGAAVAGRGRLLPPASPRARGTAPPSTSPTQPRSRPARAEGLPRASRSEIRAVLVVDVPERSLLQDAPRIRHLEQDDRTTAARAQPASVVEKRAVARDVLQVCRQTSARPGRSACSATEPLPAIVNHVGVANGAGGVDARAVPAAELGTSRSAGTPPRGHSPPRRRPLRATRGARSSPALELVPERTVVGRVRGSLDAARRVLTRPSS